MDSSVSIRKTAYRIVRFVVCALTSGIWMAVALPVWLASCSSTPPASILPRFENREHGRFPAEGLSPCSGYRIGVGDELKIDVYRYTEFCGEAYVDSQGNIRVPFTKDRLQVKNLTVEDVEDAISKIIQPYLSREPRVTVYVEVPQSQFFYVMGAVRKPGKYPMGDENLFVREAIARAGWPLEVAALKRTWLVSSKPDYDAMRKVDLKDIIYKGDLGENYKMEPGDIVWVPYTHIYEFVWHARQVLQPFTVLVNYKTTADSLQGMDQSFDTSKFFGEGTATTRPTAK